MSDILSSKKPFETRSNEEWQERITQAYGETVKFISVEQPDMTVDWRTRGRKERLVTIHCDKCNTTRNVKTITIRTRINQGFESHCPNCEQIARKRQKAEHKEKARLYFVHIRKYEQLAFLFCECGQIVKKKGMLCDNCRIIHKREADRRKETRRHRLRVKAQDKDITLQGLFERDNGICYLCGLPCNWDDCRTDDNGNFIVGRTYPTIEHVLPLCKGGTDTWNNIKLAHHGCNSAKGRRILDEHIPQYRTIGA